MGWFRRTRSGGEHAPLPVPPFRPDPEVPTPGVAPRSDIAETVRALGLDPTLEELVDGTPVWTAPLRLDPAGVATWQRLRDLHPETGWWPLLAAESTRETTAWDERFTEVGPVATGVSVLERKWAEMRSGDPVPVPRADVRPGEAEDPARWERLLLDSGDLGLDRVWLVPAAAGWQVPQVLDWMGATNVDVLGDDHAAVLRRWAGRWDVELVGLTLDVAVLRVGRPPGGTEALEAAVEVLCYCEDAVFQGADTVDELADLLTTPLWAFWWD